MNLLPQWDTAKVERTNSGNLQKPQEVQRKPSLLNVAADFKCTLKAYIE